MLGCIISVVGEMSPVWLAAWPGVAWGLVPSLLANRVGLVGDDFVVLGVRGSPRTGAGQLVGG